MNQPETDILQAFLAGARSPSESAIALTQIALTKPEALAAFGILPEFALPAMHQRLTRLQQVYPQLQPWCVSRLPQSPWLETLWQLWLPLAMQLAEFQAAQNHPIVQGILGGQGTGKSTLGAALTQILHSFGIRTLSLSLDDLYKTYADRQQLRQQDPRLIWRGPPGTHDVELGIQVLEALRQGQPNAAIAIPRFDKSLHQGAGDRIAPELVRNIDIVLFEGWFVGCRPVDSASFDNAPAPVVTERDRAFARDMNVRLAAYLPLWERCDRLMVLHPVDHRLSKTWRTQAEQQMQAAGKPGMSAAEIDAFVGYFWQALHPELFIQPLVTNSAWVDLVVEIQPDHTIGRLYCP